MPLLPKLKGNNMNKVILRKPDIEKATGYGERTVRNMEAEGNFPKRFKLNPNGRAVGWWADEVEDWAKERAASRDLAD